MFRRKIVISVLLTFIIGIGSIQAKQASDTVTDTLRNDIRLGTFASLLEEANLLDSIAQDGESMTVFAPTDDAFAELPNYVMEYLRANPDMLEHVLNNHLITGMVSLENLLSQPTIETLDGGSLNIEPELMRINGVDLVEADITASNGTIHIIDSVMIPAITLPPVDAFINFDSIVTAGSSTVQPITERMRDRFSREGFSGEIIVEETGTNVGIERFCVNAETDIANASRPIRDTEVESCRANGREIAGFFVAVDALAITVSRENDFVDNLTIEQLAHIFTGEYTRWSDVDASYPDEAIETYSPGNDSGTFVYFTDAVIANGLDIEADAAATAILNNPSIRFSEDDNILVQGVEQSPYAIGYFGFAYYIANQDRLRVINIEGIEPNESTAESGTYSLSRPLFIYSSVDVMRDKPQVAEFISFYIHNVRSELGIDDGKIGYFPVNENILNLDRLEWLAATNRPAS